MNPINSLLFAILTIILLQTNVFSSEINTNDLARQKQKLLKRKMGLTSKVVDKKLEKAFSYVRREKFNQAVEVLVDLLKQTKNRPYEYAQIWQNLGFILAQKTDYKKAIKALENSLALEQLPFAQTLSSMYTLAQLHLTLEDYKKTKEIMTEWFFFAEKPAADAHILMATALSQLDEKSEALKHVNEAINTATQPQEKWLQFALALNHELKQFDNSLKILAILTSTYPENPKYFKQMSSTYLSLGQDAKALATMELAMKQGHVNTEAELINMASLYVFLEMPIKGAELIQREIIAKRIQENKKNLELLSQAWLLAREFEKSLVTLQRAAEISKSGELLARKGFLHLEREEWSKAVDSIEASLKLPNTMKKEKLHFALGMAKYNQKDLDGALSQLMTARKHNSEDKIISKWIDQIKAEKLNQSI